MNHFTVRALVSLLIAIPFLTGAEPADQAGKGQAPATAPAAAALRRIVIAETMEQAAALPPAAAGEYLVVADSLAFLNRAELEKRLIGGKGAPITEGLLVKINQVIEGLVRATEDPLAAAVIPAQNIDGGIVTVTLTLGRYREIKFQGNRWYSEALLREKLQIESGRTIRMSTLDQAIGTTNSAYRNVKVHIDPIPNSTEANLIVSVQDKLPLRIIGMADNAGNEILGKTRFIGGVSYANLWGRDHSISYQYITSEKYRNFAGHIMDYTMPLPRQQTVNISAAFIEATPTFYDGLLAQDGKNISVEAKYSRPLRLGHRDFDWFASAGFKETNNNLEFGGESVLANKADIFQVITGLSTVIRDSRGGWALSGTITYSPGNVNSRNTTALFDDSRLGAKANYVVGNLTLQRLLKLGGGWELFTRATVQRASGNLLSSEQFNMGGASTVRGYRENSVSGDHGISLSSELNSPVWSRSGAKWRELRLNELRGLIFYDLAKVGIDRITVNDQPTPALASVGVGLRARFANHFSAQADYGWKLLRSPRDTDAGRGHVKGSFSY